MLFLTGWHAERRIATTARLCPLQPTIQLSTTHKLETPSQRRLVVLRVALVALAVELRLMKTTQLPNLLMDVESMLSQTAPQLSTSLRPVRANEHKA